MRSIDTLNAEHVTVKRQLLNRIHDCVMCGNVSPVFLLIGVISLRIRFIFLFQFQERFVAAVSHSSINFYPFHTTFTPSIRQNGRSTSSISDS